VKKLILLASTAVVFPTAAFAQSTGSVDFEKDTIVVTGTRTQEVGGIQAPDTSKPKAVLTQEAISRDVPGQTVLDTINIVPGVSFQNNDATGMAGGTLTVRGFDSTRVSYTLDGIQLNDSGNYNIYSNFSIDPELIEQVNVNLGSTDVDSPTASAAGGTINQRTRLPTKEFGARVLGSIGGFDYNRVFVSLDSGEFTPWGTRAFVTASRARADNPYNGYGQLKRNQYNARIYQPLGSNGDFVSLSGRYNRDRNNFFGSVALRYDRDVPSGFPQSRDEREYEVAPCLTDQPSANVRDTSNSCGTEFDRRYNPSNSANIRGNSRFTLAEGLVLTIDPSFQYTKANGGGTVRAEEGRFTTSGLANPITGSILTSSTGTTPTPYFNLDLNGDGDKLDQVILANPSQTVTNRYGVIAGLRWEINDDHMVRATFTRDFAKHRQTGEYGRINRDGEPDNMFPINDPLVDENGFIPEKRDRDSRAILTQLSGEYRGEFLNDALTVNVGVRAPFFTRRLDQRCYTVNAAGGVTCFGANTADEATFAAKYPRVVNPDGTFTGFAPPEKRTLKYDKLLPNVGFIFDITNRASVFANYSKGFSVPSTDNLYNAFYFPKDFDQAKPNPEVTDTYDAGVRYRSSKIQAQASIWKTLFTDRLASAYDPEINATVYRNLGKVDKWGLDGSVAFQPVKPLTLYAFGSINRSKIKDNIQIGGGDTFDCDDVDRDTLAARQNCVFTAGKAESGAPKWSYGFSGQGDIGPLTLGLTAKKTGPRYVFDSNETVYNGNINTPSGYVEIFPAKVPAYWLVNADARLSLEKMGLEKTYFQLNVYNLFDKLYVGGFSGGLAQTPSSSGSLAGPPFVQMGVPRTVIGSINVQF